MKRTCVIALMVLVSATSASAAKNDKNDKNSDRHTSASDQKAKSDNDPDKVICHTNRATGSLTRVNRVCHTRAEWAEISRDAKKQLNDYADHSAAGMKASQ